MPFARDLHIPFIVTSVAGLEKQFEDDRDGVFVQREDSQALASDADRAMKAD